MSAKQATWRTVQLPVDHIEIFRDGLDRAKKLPLSVFSFIGHMLSQVRFPIHSASSPRFHFFQRAAVMWQSRQLLTSYSSVRPSGATGTLLPK